MEFDYDEMKQCELCGNSFGLTRHRHKCKRCRLIVCADCGKTKSIIIGVDENPAEPHRICNPCSVDVAFIKDFKKKNDTAWATTSKLGNEWYYHACSEGIEDDYTKHLDNAPNIPEIQHALKLMSRDIDFGRADREMYNYSMLEWLFYNQEKVSREQVRMDVKNVVKAFYAKYKYQHVNIVISVATFLLSIVEEAKAFAILCYINERILPMDFWNRGSPEISYTGFNKEKYILRKYCEEKMKFDFPEKRLFFFKNFLKFIDFLLGGLFVNTVNFSSLMHIWSESFKNGINYVENYAWRLLLVNKQFFEQHPEMNLLNFQTFVCRTINDQNIKEYKAFIDGNDRERLEKEFLTKGLEQLLVKKQYLTQTIEFLQSIPIDKFQAIYIDISKKINEVRLKLKEKSLRESIELTKKTFTSILVTILSVDQQQADQVFDILDNYEQGAINSTRFIVIMLILLTPGQVVEKVGEVFKLKDQSGKSIEKPAALQCMDWIVEAMLTLNQVEHSLLFRDELQDLVDQVRKHFKTQKIITGKQFIQILDTSYLRVLLLDEIRRSNSMESKVRTVSTENVVQEPVRLLSSPVDLPEALSVDHKSTIDDEIKLIEEKKVDGRDDETKIFERQAKSAVYSEHDSDTEDAPKENLSQVPESSPKAEGDSGAEAQAAE
jgi:hypothetical protein